MKLQSPKKKSFYDTVFLGGRGGLLAIDFDELSYYFAVWNTGRRLDAGP